MVSYGSSNSKRHITVITDISCGWCQRLHKEIDSITGEGIEVRYIAFPRQGINSKSFHDFVSIWCNADQQSTLTASKAGETIQAKTCENPITENYYHALKIFNQIGRQPATPYIIFDDGRANPGYLPPAELLKKIGLNG